jgi:serine phosphatase RsbU (regulator of sigma subunit)
LEEVRASDVVILVVGFLYGSLVPGSEFSYTQTEYEEAHKLGKTCLVYVRDEEAVLPVKYTERDPSKLRRWKDFRDLVEGRHTVARFRESADLASQIAADLSRLVEKSRRPEPPEAAIAPSAEAQYERELASASFIQQQLLPHAALRGEGFDIAGLCVPCRTIGGDYYDFFPYSEGCIAIVIADVAGKGVPAALMMSALQARVRILAEYCHPPAEFIRRLNRSMYAHTPSNRYVTLFFALLDTRNGDLIYCNAGHNAAMVAREDGSVERLSGEGVILGVFDAMNYENLTKQYTTRLEAGDALLLYTDGISECVNHADFEFGEDRIAAVLRQNRDRPSDAIGQAILSATREWTADEFPDDLALVAARRT